MTPRSARSDKNVRSIGNDEDDEEIEEDLSVDDDLLKSDRSVVSDIMLLLSVCLPVEIVPCFKFLTDKYLLTQPLIVTMRDACCCSVCVQKRTHAPNPFAGHVVVPSIACKEFEN
jgi:hypothetical protein